MSDSTNRGYDWDCRLGTTRDQADIYRISMRLEINGWNDRRADRSGGQVNRPDASILQETKVLLVGMS